MIVNILLNCHDHDYNVNKDSKDFHDFDELFDAFDHTPHHTGWQPWRGYVGIPRPRTIQIPTNSTKRSRFKFNLTHINKEIEDMQQKRIKLTKEQPYVIYFLL